MGREVCTDTAESICVSVHFTQMSSSRTEDVNSLKTLARPMPHYLVCVEILLKLQGRNMKCELRSNDNRVAYSAFSHGAWC